MPGQIEKRAVWDDASQKWIIDGRDIDSAPPPGPTAWEQASAWVRQRSSETTTHAGFALAGAAGPQLGSEIVAAAVAGMSGDYVGAVTHGVPALMGILGSVALIMRPDPKGKSDEEIKTLVKSMSRVELLGLLDSAPVQSNPGVQSGATPGAQ